MSLWWVLGTRLGTSGYGTNLFDAVNPDADANGHVTFFARGLAAVAAAAAAMAPRASRRRLGRTRRRRWRRSGGGGDGIRVHRAARRLRIARRWRPRSAACLAYAQTALASDAHAARYAATEAEDEYEGERVAGSNPGSSDAQARDAHAFLFGANGR